ncbi:MAG TPA: GyrI-like domain-containing protein [Kineosporiaceae bacterium]|nr:GyrI-like domain-containing protein [Kineosporiaceae bacterium]
MSEVLIRDEAEQVTAVVHEVVAMSALPDFFARALSAAAATAGQQGLGISGPPFALYHGMPGPQGVDVEAGFPVSGTVRDGGDVVASRLPAGPTAVALHVGPYEGLPQTYDEVIRRLREEGLAPSTDMWEEYLSDPATEPDPQTWRTVVHWPARTAG